jgi:Tfp pilus assembly protein PilX
MRRWRGEDGWTLVTALVLMIIMLGATLAMVAYVDNETRQGAKGRHRETAFNLAEAALNAQIFALSQQWAGQGLASNPYPTCTQASTDSRCPNAATLGALFTSPDATGATWKTQVRDNNTASSSGFYSDALTASAPGYDANGDGKVWVRAQAAAKGVTRTVVALVRTEEVQEDLPHAALLAGKLSIPDNGHKVMIDGSTASAQAARVAVRCTPVSGESTPCLGHALGSTGLNNMNALYNLLDFQISPDNTTYGYTGGQSLTADQISRLRNRAIADGTYYATCPANSVGGKVVFIESGACNWQSTNNINSAASPGFLLLNNATMYLAGSQIFYGVMYAANPTGSTAAQVQVQGNGEVVGGVIVDGPGGFIAGSSLIDIKAADIAWNSVASYGTAGLIQNTWREIKSTS